MATDVIGFAHTSTGKTVYALIRNRDSEVYNTIALSFEAYSTGNLGDYVVSLTEEGTASRYYSFTFPSYSAGLYFVSVYEQAGGSPAEGDTPIASGYVLWDSAKILYDERSLSSGAITSGTFASGAITAAAIAADAIGASELATDAVNEIRDAILSDSTAFNGADIAAILTDTAEIGTAGAGLTAVGIGANGISNTAFSSGAIDAAALASDAIDLFWDEPLGSHTTSDTPGSVLNMLTQDTVDLSTEVALGSIIGQLMDDGTSWSFDRSTDSLEALRGNQGTGGLTPLASGTAQSGTASTIVLAAAASFADNVLNGNIVKITSGTGAGQARVIISNTLADDTCNVAPNWTTNPSSDSVYEIVEGSVNVEAVSLDNTAANNLELAFDGTGFGFTGCTMPTVTTLAGHTAQTGDSFARLGAPAGASVSADVASVQADTTAIVADTNELQTDWVDGGRLDLIVDAILVDTGTTLDGKLDTAQADLDIITGADGVNLLSATQASIDAIEADTNELQGDWVDGGRLDLIVDAILVDTGTTLDGKIDTIDTNVDAILVDTAEIGVAGAGLTAIPSVVGTGADSVTVNIKIGGVDVADADVWITSDAGGDTVVAGTLQTDSSGNATFMLDAGSTYYLWMQKNGVNAIQGESFVAVADA